MPSGPSGEHALMKALAGVKAGMGMPSARSLSTARFEHRPSQPLAQPFILEGPSTVWRGRGGGMAYEEAASIDEGSRTIVGAATECATGARGATRAAGMATKPSATAISRARSTMRCIDLGCEKCQVGKLGARVSGLAKHGRHLCACDRRRRAARGPSLQSSSLQPSAATAPYHHLDNSDQAKLHT